MRAGSGRTAPAESAPGSPPRCEAAALPAPSRPCGPGWAVPAPHAGTCGRAGRTGGAHSRPAGVCGDGPRCPSASSLTGQSETHSALSRPAGSENGQEINAEPDLNKWGVCARARACVRARARCVHHSLRASSHLVPTTTLRGRYYYYHSHFTDESTGVQGIK